MVILEDMEHKISPMQSATLDTTPAARITIWYETILDVKQTKRINSCKTVKHFTIFTIVLFTLHVRFYRW